MKLVFTLNAYKILITLILIVISLNCNASGEWIKVGVTSDGKPIMVSPTGNRYVSPHYEPFAGNYRGISSGTGLVRGSNGAISANTVHTTVTQNVSKRSVMSSILDKARTGGKALGKGAVNIAKSGVKGGIYGFAFSLALDALLDSDFFWDDEKGDFVKPKDDNMYLVFSVNNATNNKASGIASSSITDEASYKQVCAGQCSKIATVKGYQNAYNLAKKYCKEREYEEPGWSGYCVRDGGAIMSSEYAVMISNWNDYIPISLDDFIREGESEADNNPNEWVETSQVKPNDEPKVEVPAGTVAQSQTYTDPKDGKVKQTRWDFDGAGKVRETTIERPDLTPDSPEAPKLNLPMDDPDKTGDKEDEKDKTKDASAPQFDLCKEHPDVLACQQMGEAKDGMFDDIEVPHINDDTTWKEDSFLPADGVCPEPKIFHVWGKAFSISYEPLCELMRKVRFIVLIAFVLMSAYVCFGGLKKE